MLVACATSTPGTSKIIASAEREARFEPGQERFELSVLNTPEHANLSLSFDWQEGDAFDFEFNGKFGFQSRGSYRGSIRNIRSFRDVKRRLRFRVMKATATEIFLTVYVQELITGEPENDKALTSILNYIRGEVVLSRRGSLKGMAWFYPTDWQDYFFDVLPILLGDIGSIELTLPDTSLGRGSKWDSVLYLMPNQPELISKTSHEVMELTESGLIVKSVGHQKVWKGPMYRSDEMLEHGAYAELKGGQIDVERVMHWSNDLKEATISNIEWRTNSNTRQSWDHVDMPEHFKHKHKQSGTGTLKQLNNAKPYPFLDYPGKKVTLVIPPLLTTGPFAVITPPTPEKSK